MASATPHREWGPPPRPEPLTGPVRRDVPPPHPGPQTVPDRRDLPLPPIPRRSAARRTSVFDQIQALPVAIGGLLLVLGGAVLQGVAFLGLSWLKTAPGPAQVSYGFGDFSDRTQRGWAFMYFAFGAWLLLAIVLLVCGAACVRWKGARAFRYIGALVAILAAFGTVAAVLVFVHQSHNPVFHVAGNYAAGPYVAVIGLVVSALGAAAGGSGRFAPTQARRR